jgi:hypothetical protein
LLDVDKLVFEDDIDHHLPDDNKPPVVQKRKAAQEEGHRVDVGHVDCRLIQFAEELRLHDALQEPD